MGDFSRDHLVAVLFVLFVLSGFAWHEWEFRIRPAMIPRAEIAALADALIARYGEDAPEVAFIHEDSAWRRSHTFEQGKWHRVRREIARRRAT